LACAWLQWSLLLLVMLPSFQQKWRCYHLLPLLLVQ
jgi:hypothetical protein